MNEHSRLYHFSSIKQIEEKNVASEIELMLWSNRMDIVALANAKGEVALHRLSWTRAWILSPDKEGNRVKGMSWRPDGKVLAIAYSSGEVVLVSVENKCKLHSIEINDDVTCLFWTQEKSKQENSNLFSVANGDGQTEYLKYVDFSDTYLPDIKRAGNYTSPSSSTEGSSKTNVLQNQTEFNLLAIGTGNGALYLNIFGCFPCAILNLSESIGFVCEIVSVNLSEDLGTLFVVVKDEMSLLRTVVINTAILKTHTKELFAVASKHERLNALIDYVTGTIGTVTETWENILLEMDNELTKYASKVPEGGLTADFLDLLMFGIYSDEIEEFLLHDLTKKGLEKFGQTIELSYANIQKLLLKYVTKIGQNITYHLAELRGLARMKQRYEILGLHEDKVTEAILSNGAFLIKTGEMQEIINHSMINYKAFFRWLYTSIMHLIDEPIPPQLTKMTQQDLANIAEFIQNFNKIGKDSNDPGFIMERLGQYLTDAPLTIPPNMEGNDWDSFLKQNQCVQDHPAILQHYREMSLIQQLKHLKSSIEDIFVKPKDFVRTQFKVENIFNCFDTTERLPRISQTNYNPENTFIAFLHRPPPSEKICILNIKRENGNTLLKGAYFHFTQHLSEGQCKNYEIVDVSFYSPTVLSLLLQDEHAGALCQFSVTAINEKLVDIDTNLSVSEANLPMINGCEGSMAGIKNLDNMSVSRFAVSGSRRVAIVLGSNRRKIRLFEMEAEEEDEEDADASANTIKDSDVSMQNSNIFE